MSGTPVSSMASEDARAASFAMPRGACDCHTHVFGPASVYPYWDGRGYTPPDASAEELGALHRGLGIERVVIVHPSPYGIDNRISIDAAVRMGLERARVVAVIDPATIGDTELSEMSERGVVGVRLNLSSGGVSDAGKAREMLQKAAGRVGRLGWHVQIFTTLVIIDSLARDIETLGVPVVADHFGGAKAAAGVNQAGFETLSGLVSSGRMWVKLSAGYRVSSEARWRDVDPLARHLLAANPDRCVWGTDWPHPGERPPGTPPGAFVPAQDIDDTMAVEALWRWCGEDAGLFRRVLTDNPARLYNFQADLKSERA